MNEPLPAPVILGMAPSFGFGDRTGLATPGHVASMKRCGDGIEAIYPQQSIREMARTDRTAQEVMAHIRSVLGDLIGAQAGSGVPLLYGGSVNPSNIEGFMAQQDVNGALVGGASLDAEPFCQIVELASRRA